MVHEQKFKDLQVAHARLAQKGECWTWNQRLIRGPGSILTGGIILLLEFFDFLDANIGIIANFVQFVKKSNETIYIKVLNVFHGNCLRKTGKLNEFLLNKGVIH